ncbi:XdhC family protein [Sunxiuqinia sp. A32]|uniref:XdhC family protein n=1 Tax=Sunxiuqinia sp. A32 TaxID=3461496 RepID=UPI0040456460
MENLFETILSHLTREHPIVLGTLIKTKGSTPQVPGSSAIFNSEGIVFGTLGGGILEAEAQKLAFDALKQQHSIVTEFSLDGKMDDDKGAICGGSALFFLDANTTESFSVFQQVVNSLQKQIAGILITVIEQIQGQHPLITRFWIPENEEVPLGLKRQFKLEKEYLKEFLAAGKAQILSSSDQPDNILFAEPIQPTPKLVIVGAGHIGQSLCHLGHLLDFKVTVLDNRAELATKERFPETVRIIIKDITKAFQEITITKNSFIVILTQSHRTDMEALAACIKSEAAYIGMIGSKRKIKLVREKFICDGICSAEEFERIHAPVGIDIRSQTVPEIATSIAAQLVKVRHEKKSILKTSAVWCIILAAGQSKRMEQQKLLMPWNGHTIIETVIQKAKASIADKVLVVKGSHKEGIEEQINKLQVLAVENVNYKKGMLSSIQCGVNSISSEAGAVIILLGDQPMLQSDVINQLIRSWQKSYKGIIVPVWKGKRGHPILIDIKFKEEINHLNPDIGLRELLLNHPNDILEIDVQTGDILKDIDTPEDYRKELKQNV